MITNDKIRILKQYINALDEATQTLEKMYLQKNIVGFEKTKQLIKELQSKISLMLK